jgi:hypothetical protein
VAILEQTAHDLEKNVVPRLQELLARWRRRVLWSDGILFGVIVVGVLGWNVWTGEWLGGRFISSLWQQLFDAPVLPLVVLGVVLGLAGYVHFSFRRMAVKHIIAKLQRDRHDLHETEFLGSLGNAFRKNTRFWRSIFCQQPTGWGHRARRLLAAVRSEANTYVQALNNRFTNPSGTSDAVEGQAADVPTPEKVAAAE